jgi:ribosomal protein S18 acetylase RimI-like enzyme
VFEVSLDKLDGKAKLAQNRKPLERMKILEGLWKRGDAGDLRAIELVLAANPDTPRPDFLRAPEGMMLSVFPSESDARAVAELLANTYWNDRFTPEELASAHIASNAWVVAKNESGQVLGSARAISDGSKRAWIYDVIVHESLRRTGLGDRLMRLLLDHPKLRRTRLISLGTRDAAEFYSRLGFKKMSDIPKRPYVTTEMVLIR